MNHKIAILDLYNGNVNRGIKGIINVIERYASVNQLTITYEVFNLRVNNEIPEVSNYDMFISSGGPGSPIDSKGSEWENRFFNLVEAIKANNIKSSDKKYLFLICHSFQIYFRYYNYGLVCERKSTSYGVVPVNKTIAGLRDKIIKNLSSLFYVFDNRNWQIIEPNLNAFFETNAEILVMEKERPNIPLERAITAIRFSDEIYGTQFHPEVDGPELKEILINDTNKGNEIKQKYGDAKYQQLLEFLDDPEKLILTQEEILPNFLSKKFGKSEN